MKHYTHSKFSYYLSIVAIAYMAFLALEGGAGAQFQTAIGGMGFLYILLVKEEPILPTKYKFQPHGPEEVINGMFLAAAGIAIQILTGIFATITIERTLYVIAAAVCEELFFRALLCDALKRTLTEVPALVLSALAFALAHTNYWDQPQTLLALFLFGNLLALVYMRKDLTTVMLSHLFLNIAKVMIEWGFTA